MPVLVTWTIPPALLTDNAPLPKERFTSLSVSSKPLASSEKSKPAEKVWPRMVIVSVWPAGVDAVKPSAVTFTVIAPAKETPVTLLPAATGPAKPPVIAPLARSSDPLAWAMLTRPLPTLAEQLLADRFVAEWHRG